MTSSSEVKTTMSELRLQKDPETQKVSTLGKSSPAVDDALTKSLAMLDVTDRSPDEERSTTQSPTPSSPVTSCVSMSSNISINLPPRFQETSPCNSSPTPSSPITSCVSMSSNISINLPPRFQETSPCNSSLSQKEECYEDLKSEWSMDPPNTFTASKDIPSQQEERYEDLKSEWSMDPPNTFTASKDMNVQKVQTEASMINKEAYGSVENSIRFDPQSFRMTISKKEELQHKFKTRLKDKFQYLYNALQGDGHAMLLNEIYTELYITEGEIGEVNIEHEVRQIEISTRRQQSGEDIPIKYNDIFKPLPGCDKPIRTVLTKGVAGIGKTVSVQKFILDWAEGKANQDIQFIFPLSFRELNLMSKHQHFTLETLIQHFFPKLKEKNVASCLSDKIMFIFDGLDECRLPLNFHKTALVSEVTMAAPVVSLLINLIKGQLLGSALIWITSRPAAASQIPPIHISQLTEIRGFNDEQKEEYFKKMINDQSINDKIITHLKSSRSLYIMCHIPVFCWISATVLEQMLQQSGVVIPKTLTGMYTHFLIIQTRIRNTKYNTAPVNKEIISKLGELAFKQLLKGNLIFYEEDLKACGIRVKDAVIYSGVCTQIFREESEHLYGGGKVFCFVHLSIQEHLAALYVHLTFSQGNKTVLNQWQTSNKPITFQCKTIVDLHNSAIDKALQNENGQFDLFLRFLLGLSLDSNQSLLQELLPKTSVRCFQNVQTVEYIKTRLRINLIPEKYMNLFYCLNELNDFSLEEEIQNLQKTRRLTKTRLSASQWSALVFVLLTSGSALDVFDPWKYSVGDDDECLLSMLPVLTASKTAEVRDFTITDKGFKALASAISSKATTLRKLKLSGNPLPLSGIQTLSEGLKHPNCKLELLELSACDITGEHSKMIGSALQSNPTPLKELDLNFNPLKTFGIIFTDYLSNPHCGLEKLKLVGCQLADQSCACLNYVLNSNSKLMELDLSRNPLKDSGVTLLSSGLRNTGCILRSLRLADCKMTMHSCSSLCDALTSNNKLSELCLDRNSLQDEGVIIISDLLKKSRLEKLSLSYCNVTERGCNALAQALEHNPGFLSELELTGNEPGAAVKKKLTNLQHHKDYRLEKLKL